jgi:hypothetical protein
LKSQINKQKISQTIKINFMKRIFTFIILTLVACLNTVWAQPFHAWSIQNSGGTSQTLAGSVVNNQGHVFNYGIFSGTVDFDPGPNTANYTAVGTSDLFIQKLDASGNLLWLIRLGNYSATWNVYDIALDPVSGDILLTGRVFQFPSSQIDFNPGPGVAYVTGDNAFLWRLGTNGNFGFVRTWHHDVIFNALHVASNGDIYLGGYFASHNQGYYDMDPNAGSFSFSSFGVNKDGFLIKLSSNSTFQWAKQLKSNNSAGLPVINGICTNNLNQNVFIVGRYSGSVIFRPTEAPLIVTTSAGFQDIFMQTFVSTNGNAYAVSSIGGMEDDAATAVITNGSTVYVGGYFGGTVNFDPGFSNTTLTSLGQSDVFLLRLTNFPPQTGANLSWVRRTGGTLNESLESLSLDAAGNVYSALNFNGSIDADPGAGTFTLTSAGQQDFAVQKIDQNGNFIWAVSVGGADYDLITSIHATNNDVYYSGKFSGTVDLNPTAGTQNFSTSGGFDSDIFTTRLSQCGDIPVISSNSPVCELSTINLEAPTIPGATYSWSGPGGYSSTAEDATRPNANGSHAGTYYLTVSVGTCVYPVASTQVQIASLYPIVSITPTNVSACSSGAAPINFTSSLSTNAFPLSYQWQKNNVNIPGATSPSYSIASPTLADAGSYRLVVTTVCNTANSPSATVNIDPSAPVITTQPSPSALSVCQGGTLNLSAGATNGTITYQWQRNGSNIAGANSPTYSDPYVDLSEGGTYQLVASNACGSVTSQTVNVDVQFTVPSITTQPISQSICEGDNVTFSVIANYVSNYQWTKNGVNIPGATSANYSISAAQFTDAGNYAVVLSNGCGSVTSSVATLTVNGTTPIMITSQPQSVNICVGSSVTFTVLANGSIGSYQWRKNGVNIPGANSATYTIPSVTPSSAGSYDVVISSPCTGSVTSTAATLNVLNNTPVDNGLVFYLPFDGNTTEAINNTSSTGYYTYAAATDRFGNPNGAANFASGTFREYNTYPGQPTGNSPYTISTWINVASGQWNSSNGICGWGNQTNNQSNRLRLENNGYVNYWWLNDFNATIPPAQMQTGVWKHIVVTYDGTTQRFYENGVQIASRVPTTPASVALTTTVVGAGLPNNQFYKGMLDELRIYNRAITAAEVSTLYNYAPLTAASLPATQTTCIGSIFTQTVNVTGAELLTYQWYFNGNPLSDGGGISGTQTATLTISNVSAAHAGNYTVHITQGCDKVVSNTMALNVVNSAPIVINSQPQPLTLCSGSSATFSVSATGSIGSYQWRKNGVNIPGATSSSYTISNVSPSESGSYDVVISGPCGNITSQSATLTVLTQTFLSNGLVFYLPFDGNATEAINNTSSTGTYTYAAASDRFGNPNGAANFASNTFRQYATYPGQPTGNSPYTISTWINVAPGEWNSSNGICGWGSQNNNERNSLRLDNNGYVNYWWVNDFNATIPPAQMQTGVWKHIVVTYDGTTQRFYENGVQIASRVPTTPASVALTTTVVGAGLPNNQFYKGMLDELRIYNRAITAAEVSTLYNYVPLTAASIPATQGICAGSNYTQTVNVTGAGELAYQWYFNGNPLSDGGGISGTQTATLTISNANASHAGNYTVHVTQNGCVTQVSNTMALNVFVNSSPIVINSQPQPLSVCSGSSAIFSVSATGSIGSYQWRKNGVNISGATSSSYTISNVTPSDTGSYDVVITDACSGNIIISQSATLTIVPQPILVSNGLVFYLPFDGNTTEVINNTSSTGTYTYAAASDRFGNPNGAANFASNTFRQYATYPGQPTGNSPYTISTWINVASGQWNSSNGICGWGNQANNQSNSLRLDNNGYLNYWWANDFNVTIPPAQMQTDVWKHIVVTYDGTTQRFYENGVEIATRVPTTPANVASTVTRIGRAIIVSETFKGRLDDFRIYNRAITAAEVSTLYNYLPLTAASLPATQTACAGSTFTQTVNVTGAELLTYQWYYNGNPLSDGGGISGTQTATLTISNVSAAHAGNYTVHVIQNGCVTQVSNIMALNINNSIAITTQPSNQTICENQPLNLSVTATGTGLTYQWTLNGNNIPGATSATYSVASATVANAGNYQVVVSNTACSLLSNVVSVTVNTTAPSQPAAISGTTTVCQGSTQTYSVAAVPGATSYTWTLPSGWTGSSTTNSITATVGANSGNITVTANNTCGSSTAQTLAITVNTVPTQPGAISGTTTVCQGSTQTYSVAAVPGATSYTWTLPSGWTGSSTTNSIAATVGSNGGNIAVTANNACGSSTPRTLAVTVTPIPSQPGAISGTSTVCQGSTQTYSVSPVTGATSYTWTLPSGWTGSSTTNSINAIVGANSGNITVTANNACGSSTAQTLAITVNQLPTQPGSISGTTTVCQGSTQTYSVAAVSGATSYTWTLPSGWTGSSTTNSISATVGANSGNITVTANNTCGSSTAQTLAITVNTVPTQPGAISGTTTVCQGSTQTYSVAAVSGATSYTWTLPSGWTGSSTTNSISATVGANSGNITVTANNACGSSTAQTLAITLTPIPSQPGVISGSASVCAGTTQTYSVGAVSGATSYTWTLPSGWTGSSTTNSITTTVGTSGGNITVTANNACGSSTPQTLAVVVNPGAPAQPSAITGNTTVCENSTQTYSVAAVSGATSYTWTLPNGWTGSSTSDTIQVTAGSNGGIITVTADNGCGSSTAQTLAITVNTVPSQPGAISGTTSACEASTQTYSVAAVSGATSYTWTLPSGWTGSSTTNSISATVGANSGNITVTANNACGSSVAQSLAITVNPLPLQPTFTSGNASVCANTTQTYSVSSVGATSYTWTLPSGWTGSSTTNNITATAGTNGGTITVVANNACGSSSATTLAVVVNPGIPAQPSAITGNTTVCESSTQTYSVAAVSGATSYTWTLPNGWTGSSTSDTIQVTAGPNGGTITVTADNGCGSSTAQSIAISVNPLPAQPGAISGTTSICEGTTQTYSIAAVPGATSYTWTLPNGWTGSSTTDNITVTVGANSGNVSVTADNACGSSTPQTLAITVTPLPEQPAVINGAASVCENTTQTYSVSSAGASSYTWTLPSGWTGSSTTDSITATAGTNGGTITVVANNTCGSSNATSLAVVVSATAPLQPSAIIGDTIVCENSTQTYSVSSAGATSYTWTLPSGWTGSSTSDTIQVVVDSNGGIITVIAHNGCGSSPAQSINITVNALPTVSANASATSVCQGNQVTLTGSGAASYVWDNGVTNGMAFIPTATTTYTVTGTDANGCSNTAQITITVNPLPNVTVSNNANTLTVNQAGATYQWIDCNNNNAPISGATNQSFTPTTGGNYAVVVTLNGCVDTSACQTVTITGLDTQASSKLPFSIYPNPNRGNFTIQSTKGGVFELIDVTGKVIHTYSITNTQQTVNENIPAGMYFVREKESGTIQKLIVQ